MNVYEASRAESVCSRAVETAIREIYGVVGIVYERVFHFL